MEIDLETIMRALTILALIISVGSAVIVWLNSPGRKLQTGLKELSDKVVAHNTATLEAQKGHDRRIQKVEDELKHLPTSGEFSELQIAVTRVEGDVKRIEETLGRTEHVVNRIDDYLRANK